MDEATTSNDLIDEEKQELIKQIRTAERPIQLEGIQARIRALDALKQ